MKTLFLDAYRINPFFMILTFLGLIIFTRKKFLSFHFTFLFWFLGLFWIYAVLRNGRFLLPLIPLFMILSAGFICFILEGRKRAWPLMGLVFVFFIVFSGQSFLLIKSQLRNKGLIWNDARKWGIWMAENIPMGEILAIREGENVCILTDTDRPQNITDLLAAESNAAGAETVVVMMNARDMGGIEPPPVAAAPMRPAMLRSSASWGENETLRWKTWSRGMTYPAAPPAMPAW